VNNLLNNAASKKRKKNILSGDDSIALPKSLCPHARRDYSFVYTLNLYIGLGFSVSIVDKENSNIEEIILHL
jgi:hypothetical protein